MNNKHSKSFNFRTRIKINTDGNVNILSLNSTVKKVKISGYFNSLNTIKVTRTANGVEVHQLFNYRQLCGSDKNM